MPKTDKEVEKEEKVIRNKEFFKRIRYENCNKPNSKVIRYKDHFIDLPIEKEDKGR